jgi:hypothetical protein
MKILRDGHPDIIRLTLISNILSVTVLNKKWYILYNIYKYSWTSVKVRFSFKFIVEHVEMVDLTRTPQDENESKMSAHITSLKTGTSYF